MSIDVRNLFKIVGEEGPALRRVEEAMEWLLSPKAEGIGQKLLEDAHALHGKPLTIAVSKEASIGYINAMGKHTVRINPHHLEKALISGTDGISHTMSVERGLGHELAHAGQTRVQEGLNERMQLEIGMGEAYQNRLTPEQKAAHAKYLSDALQASDYDTARQYVGRYVDEFLMPMRRATNPDFFSHPDFIRHLQEFEMPAVEIENRIAVLRGEPVRTDYIHTHRIAPKEEREMTIDDLSALLELSKKPRRIPPESWVNKFISEAKDWGSRSIMSR